MDNILEHLIADEILFDQVEQNLRNEFQQFLGFVYGEMLDNFILIYDDLNGDPESNVRGDAPARILNFYEEVIPQYDDE
ncbi:hypothetical protein KQX54_016419 [Cotesia glomerata]|uniref:Uncharacterized protein n=1 Tax=Cotesia glomerata TaxID=32391 RepID=A0AAV7J824_COTGL|nr:hypothetical protein KQX54_016419 [Cotesia glomerata]